MGSPLPFEDLGFVGIGRSKSRKGGRISNPRRLNGLTRAHLPVSNRSRACWARRPKAPRAPLMLYDLGATSAGKAGGTNRARPQKCGAEGGIMPGGYRLVPFFHAWRCFSVAYAETVPSWWRLISSRGAKFVITM